MIPFYTELGDFSVIPNFQGEWDFRTVYIAGSLVSYNGKLYEAQTLVDHSEDALTLLNHDDFHRADTLDGWGTSAEGITWIVDYEEDGPGSLKILNNEAVSSSSGAFSENYTFYPIPSLSTRNIDVLWRFYTTYSGYYRIFLIYFSADNEVSPLAQLSITSIGSSNNTIELDVSGADFLYSVNTEHTSVLPFDLNTDYFARIRAYGNFYGGKLWKASDQEPDEWSIVLISDNDVSANNGLVFDSLPINGSGSMVVKDVKVYGLPDVSPDQMPSEWLLIG